MATAGGAMTKSHWDVTFTLMEITYPNPTNRGKRGVKCIMLTEGHNVPIGRAIEGVQGHDMKLTRLSSESLVVEYPEPTDEPLRGCVWTKVMIMRQNYLAFLHFTCGLIAFRAAGLFG